MPCSAAAGLWVSLPHPGMQRLWALAGLQDQPANSLCAGLGQVFILRPVISSVVVSHVSCAGGLAGPKTFGAISRALLRLQLPTATAPKTLQHNVLCWRFHAQSWAPARCCVVIELTRCRPLCGLWGPSRPLLPSGKPCTWLPLENTCPQSRSSWSCWSGWSSACLGPPSHTGKSRSTKLSLQPALAPGRFCSASSRVFCPSRRHHMQTVQGYIMLLPVCSDHSPDQSTHQPPSLRRKKP